MHQPLVKQASSPDRFPICLHSAASTNFLRAHHSFLPDAPQLRLILDHKGSTWLDGELRESFEGTLDELVMGSQIHGQPASPPFLSGWILYYGFECYADISGLGHNPQRRQGDLPMACAWRVDRQFIHDIADNSWTHYIDRQPQDNPLDALNANQPSDANIPPPTNRLLSTEEEDESLFTDSCRQIIEAIARGDVIQVNLSRAWKLQFEAPLNIDAIALALAEANPSAFFCRFPLGEQTIISASPERLLRLSGGIIETRPLGGTIERLSNPDTDHQQQARLHSDAKLKSEHIMLVDLERNDLSRICEPNSVSISELAAVESHPNLHHLLSIIKGRLLPQTRPSQILQAMCPGGSISGCPKRMCLKILRELEPHPRQWYTGAFGYIDDSGNADLNLLIRSLAIHNNTINFRMGAGIVTNSNPQEELAETRLKARGLLKAISQATHNPIPSP